VVIDNSTGDIVAMAGGVGQKVEHDEYNRAAQAPLQTGSSMKPLTVYAPAFELGAISPASVITDLPITYRGGNWPKNDNRRYNYTRTIYQGVTSSVNAVAVHTLDKIGFDYSLSFAKNNLGITTLVENYTTPSGRELTDLGYAPLAMGALTLGVTVREMSQAYATFANEGVFREARTYTKVYDSAGELVMDNVQTSYQAMSEQTVNYMNYCLANAANNGTGTAAIFSGQNIYGKTGTTANNRDRWFCGFTGHYTAAVWTGYDQPETISVSTNPACTLWKKVMQPIHSGLKKISLYSTSGMKSVTVCLDSGLRATDACKHDVRGSRTASAYCYPEDAPNGYCGLHTMVEYCVEGKGVCTEYCSLFEDVEIDSVALVKLTKSDVEDIKNARNVGLAAMYYQDNYVYLVDRDGDPLDWHGFNGKANKDVEEPYIVCTIHTKEAYEAYLEEKEKEEQEKEEQEKEEQENGSTPTDPTSPTDPIDPPSGEITPPEQPTDPVVPAGDE
jgi:penicillin-binding protein 1A